MKTNIIKATLSIVVLGLFLLLALGSSESSSSSGSSSYSASTRTCQWCGDQFSGDGYYHLGNDCVVGDKNLGAGNMCSKKCCMDSWNASH
jgi:hypothetical protein